MISRSAKMKLRRVIREEVKRVLKESNGLLRGTGLAENSRRGRRLVEAYQEAPISMMQVSGNDILVKYRGEKLWRRLCSVDEWQEWIIDTEDATAFPGWWNSKNDDYNWDKIMRDSVKAKYGFDIADHYIYDTFKDPFTVPIYKRYSDMVKHKQS